MHVSILQAKLVFFQFRVLEYDKGGRVMDFILAYTTLGVLAFAFAYAVIHAFIMEDIWKGRK